MKPSLRFNGYLKLLTAERHTLQRIFYTITLFFFITKFFSHTLLHQIGREPILYQEIDPVYWLFMILNLPDLITSKAPFVLDAFLIVSCIASIIWNKQNISTIAFFIAYFIFFVIGNMITGHHHINIGILFISFPFVFKDKENFAFSFAFVRFLFCFSMFSAGIWKVVRGNLTFPDQVYTQLVLRHFNDIVQHKSALRLELVKWLMHHKYIAHFFWVTMIVIEVAFLAGFFSLKYDSYLTIGYLLFAFGGLFLLKFLIAENLLFLLTLTPALQLVAAISKNPFKYKPEQQYA